MTSKRVKNQNNKKNAPQLIYPAELAKGMKPSEVKQIGEHMYVFPMFVLDPPEPIKKRRKTKPV